MSQDPDGAGRPAADTHADRPSERSAETSPQSLYLLRIAFLERRVALLEARLRGERRDRQRLVDRYETLLADREETAGEPCADGRRLTASADGIGARAIGRVRGLLR